MTIRQIITEYSQKIKKLSSSSILDIELLLANVLNKPKEYLYQYPEKILTSLQLLKFKKLFKRRLQGEPIAYILGHKEFYGLDFKVNKNVLVPRPETELLVEEVIKYQRSQILDLRSKISIIDIGVGSGAIIIALAKNLSGKFFGTDISNQALKLAQQNAKSNKVKIKFLKGNLLQPLKSIIYNLSSNPINKLHNSAFIIQNSIITANLPYLTTSELRNPTIKKEPKLALHGGPDGLKYFKEFFSQIKKYNIKPRSIFLEIGIKQAPAIKKLASHALTNYSILIKKDLCGHDRVIIIAK